MTVHSNRAVLSLVYDSLPRNGALGNHGSLRLYGPLAPDDSFGLNGALTFHDSLCKRGTLAVHGFAALHVSILTGY